MSDFDRSHTIRVGSTALFAAGENGGAEREERPHGADPTPARRHESLRHDPSWRAGALCDESVGRRRRSIEARVAGILNDGS
jgi:hypothetical protein